MAGEAMSIVEVREADRLKTVARMDFWPAVGVTFAEYQAQRRGTFRCPSCGTYYNPTFGKACPQCGAGGKDYKDVRPDDQRDDYVGA
jgi:rubrerythrin